MLYAELHDAEVFSDKLNLPNIPPSNTPDWKYEWVKMVKFSFNKHGYRSDDFTTNHIGKHILFLGCSQTFGDGLEIEETWSNLLYNKISKTEKLSGYFNLGFQLGSMRSSLINLIQYINEFGKPHVIFLNIPHIFRYYDYDTETKSYALSMIKFPSAINSNSKIFKKIKIDFFQDYLILDSFCKLNNIMFLSTSWDFEPNRSMSINEVISELAVLSPNTFKSFVPTIEKNLREYCYLHSIKYPNDKYYLFARDHVHAGTAINKYWADLLYQEYEKRIK